MFISSLCATAQRVRPFAGFSLYLDKEFKESGYGGINAGAEFKVYKHFKPEIEINLLFGSLQNKTIRDNLGNDTNLFVRSVSAINFSLSPKICFGDIYEDDSYFFIQPKYNISRVEANGSNFIIDKINPLKSVEEKDNYLEWRHSLGIGVGFDIGVSDKNSSSVAVSLYYQGINMGNALSKLKFRTSSYSTKDVLGLGITYYIGVKNKEK